MGLFDKGPSRKDVFGATPFGQTPKFQQLLIQDAIQRGADFGTNRPELFQQVGLETAPQQALQQLSQGVGTPQIGRFDFGQRGSDVLRGSRDALRRATGFINQQGTPDLGRALQSIEAGQQGITGEQLQQGISEFINPFTEQVIDPARQDIEEQVARRQSELAGQSAGNLGAFGGQSIGIENALTNRFGQREIGRIGGQLRSQAFNTAAQQALSRLTGERERSLTAGQQFGGLELDRARTAIGAGSALGNIAAQRAGLGGRLLDARQGIQDLRDQVRAGQLSELEGQVRAGELIRQQQQAELESPLRQLDFFRNFATTQPGVGGGALPDRPGIASQLGDLGQGIGSVAGGVGTALALFSDRRLKENIVLVGTDKGFNIYEFKYIGKEGRYRGVMAQEVQEVNPEAVVEKEGHLAVHYDMIGLEMQKLEVNYG